MDTLNGRRVRIAKPGDLVNGKLGTIRGSEIAAASGIFSAALLFAIELDDPPRLVFANALQFEFVKE